MPVPDSILKAPVPFDGGDKYIQAFWDISASRVFNNGVASRLQLSEMLAYFQIYGIHDIDEREDYLHFLRAMDNVYMKHEQKRVERLKREHGAR